MHLVKTIIDKTEPPKDCDQVFYRDDQLKGFAVRVTASGVKSFVIEKLIGGKVKRITLGRYGELTVEQAHKEAQKLLYAVKRLLNHKMKNDVTAGYIISDVERLRAPMQLITNHLLKCIEKKESKNVAEKV